jgi:phosphoribosyl 1,2-cyclic phosphate phosphodiesterase
MIPFEVVFLGTGTSQGVPMLGCSCETCTSPDEKDKRLRTSILIKTESTQVVIDCGPDFRQQLLREKISYLDGVVFTHGHKDHVGGVDDVRALNFTSGKTITFHVDKATENSIRRGIPYAFEDNPYPGVPKINFSPISKDTFYINELAFQPFYLKHYKLDVIGFKIFDFVYITDANFIDNETIDLIKNCETLVINALRHEKHISHFNLEEALELISKVSPRKALLTHMSHQIGLHEKLVKQLPKHISPAYDGLKLYFGITK